MTIGEGTSDPGRWRARVNRAGAKQSGGVGWGFVGSPKSTRRSEGGRTRVRTRGRFRDRGGVAFETHRIWHIVMGREGGNRAMQRRSGVWGARSAICFFFCCCCCCWRDGFRVMPWTRRCHAIGPCIIIIETEPTRRKGTEDWNSHNGGEDFFAAREHSRETI